jgi:hypothetical protein
MTRRYVILLHTGHGPDHVDLMIEQPADLATWRIEPPPAKFSCLIVARSLAAHRLAYLDYQGPVSAGRGEVRQIEVGTCQVLQAGDDRWQVRFDGKAINGLWEFRRQAGDTWTLAPQERL